MRKYPGILIVVEGIDGSGKSSVLDRVIDILRHDGIQATKLVEPTHDSEWGREIRSRADCNDLTPLDEIRLFIEDRKWDIENNIVPSLNRGELVLMDRYFFSNAVYQSISSEYTWQEILEMNRGPDVMAPEPDMVIIFDIDIDTASGRRSRRECSENQLERRERLKIARERYIEMSVDDTSGRYTVIDASAPIDDVINRLYDTIMTVIKDVSNCRLCVHS